MSAPLMRLALHRTLDQIRHVEAVRPGAAPAPVARVYDQVERDFGMLAPPVALHAPAPDLLAATWVMLRETLVVQHHVDRAAKEVLATAVSLGNTCPYCVDVHGAASGSLGVRQANASGARWAESVADPRLRAVAEWGLAIATSSGAAGYRRPFPEGQLPEYGGVAVAFHYLNRMVNVFLGESPLPQAMPSAARPGALRVLGRFLRPGAQQAHRPGDSLGLLPAAPLPDELSWAKGTHAVAEALGRTCAAVDASGARRVPERVRSLVLDRVADWDGAPVGPSRAWVEEAIAALPEADRAHARLALLTALAAYQVDDEVVAGVYAAGADDAVLVATASWAAMAAARRSGAWLA
ncbi:carboxymuconolactone decarboxylase family protein [Nocardiopsis ansamitocini]|uniref:Alkyl hydroperoxide reductase AhpD n=1 Tax=Nocardiopsis ansamitocini TaxID=1670832 RepID=A0A9W6P7Q9_9ACTN|nr:carboxymuconolactone decarboxylase family protein [Nocardiopsis ansamitocini]GLU48720.1 alkyl hydroperoxide reductase AhpD [Nocardiopsis ansamitocini]